MMKIFYIFLVALLTFSCAKTPLQESVKKTENKEVQIQKRDTTTNPLSTIFLIEGVQAKTLGELQKAMQFYQRAISIDNRNDAAYYEISSLYQSEELLNLDEALNYIQSAANINPANKVYQTMLGQLLVDTKNYEEGVNIFKKLVADEPEKLDHQFSLATAYDKAGEYQDALDIYNRIEETYGYNPELNYEKHLLYFSLGDRQKGIEEIQKIVDKSPQYISYSLFIADYYLKNKKFDDAAKYAQIVLNQEPNNGAAFAIQLQSFVEQKNEEAFIKSLKEAINSEIMLTDKIKLFYPLIELQSRRPEWQTRIHETTRELTEKHPNSAEVYALYGDLLYNSGMHSESIPVYKQSIAIQDNVYSIWDQIINHYVYIADYDSLAPFAKKASEKFPDNPFPAYISGYAHYVNKDFNQAISLLTAANNREYEDKSFDLEIMSLLADAYHEEKRYEEAYLTYDKVLLQEPDNEHVLNNYSYYLAERKVNLAKAEKMAARALALNPENANTLDTYGWVLFQNGKYDEAVKLLAKAAKKIPDSAIVVEHYGDALYKNGKVEEAVKQWKIALSLNEGSSILRKKITAKKIID